MTRAQTRHLRPADLAGKRWRGLIRESTQAQQEKFSPERQRQDIERAARELGMVGGDKWYERVGSGEAEQAPEVAEALRDAKAGQFDVLVCFATSRLARNRYEALRIKRDFAAAGVIIYFAAERLISGTYAGALSEGIGEVLDEHANEERRLYVAGGIRERQLSGRWVGRIPLGYRKELVDFPDGTRGWDGGLEVDPETARVVRRIFDDLAGGIPPTRLMIALNVAGLRTATQRPWSRQAIRSIASNPIYKGMHARYHRPSVVHYYPTADPYDGAREIGRTIPAIVDDRLWTAAQFEHPGAKWRIKHSYPLSSVLRCGLCGFRMQGTSSARHRYYRCGGHLAGVCEATTVRADAVESKFADWLDSIRLPAGWREELAHLEVRAIVADEGDRQRKIEEQIGRLRRLYAWGDMEEGDYRTQVAQLKSEAGVMVKPDISNVERIAEALEEVGRSWRRLPLDRRRELPGRLIRSIAVVDGEFTEFLARPELKPLLELGVVRAAYVRSTSPSYTVRYSA